MIVQCPHCETTVLPNADRICPACRKLIPFPEPETEPTSGEVPEAVPAADEIEIVVAAEASPEPDSAEDVVPVMVDGVDAQFVISTESSYSRRMLPDPNLLGAIGLVLGYFMLTGCVAGALGTLYALVTNSRNVDEYVVVGMAAGSLTLAALAWIGAQPAPMRTLAMIMPQWRHLVLACLLPIPLQLLFMASEAALNKWTLPRGQTATVANEATRVTTALPAANAPWEGLRESVWRQYEILAQQPWWLVLLIGCVLPAVCEELFFRGYMGRGLIAHLGVWGGVLVTSAMFGLVHLEPLQMVYTGLMGIVLHVLYLCSKSIWAPMLMHFVNNVLAFGVLKLTLEGALPELAYGAVEIPWYLVPVSILSLAGLLYLLVQTRGAWRHADGTPLETGYVTAEAPISREAAHTFAPATLGGLAFSGGGLLLLAGVTFGALLGQRENLTAWRYVNEAAALYDEAKFAQALTLYRQAAELNPKLPEAHCGKAMAALNLGQMEQARLDALAALELHPDYAYALGTLAQAKLNLGEPQSALEDANRACQLQPEDAWLNMVRAECEFAVGSYGRALLASQEAKRLDPQDDYTRLWRARILTTCPDVNHRDPAAAIAELTEPGYALPETFEGHFALAQAYVANGELKEALAAMRAAPDGNSPEQRQAIDFVLFHYEQTGSLLMALRAAWETPWIDDLVLHPPRRHLFVIVPASELEKLRDKPLMLPEYSDWTYDVLTQPEYDQAVATACSELLRRMPHRGFDVKSIAAYAAHTPEQLASADIVKLMEVLDISRPDAQSLIDDAKQAVAQQ